MGKQVSCPGQAIDELKTDYSLPRRSSVRFYFQNFFVEKSAEKSPISSKKTIKSWKKKKKKTRQQQPLAKQGRVTCLLKRSDVLHLFLTSPVENKNVQHHSSYCILSEQSLCFLLLSTERSRKCNFSISVSTCWREDVAHFSCEGGFRNINEEIGPLRAVLNPSRSR